MHENQQSPLFRLSGVSKSYTMGEVVVDALKGVTLDIFSGELAVMLGASGSGKSTLLNIIGGLDVASRGEIFFHGKELTASTELELTSYRRHAVGFVFQFYNLIASLTALENVQLVTEIADDPMLPEEALGLVGLENRMNHFPPSFREANSSVWLLPGRWLSVPKSCCVTNRQARLIFRQANLFSKFWKRSTGSCRRR